MKSKELSICLGVGSKREAGKLNLKTGKIEWRPESKIILDILKGSKNG